METMSIEQAAAAIGDIEETQVTEDQATDVELPEDEDLLSELDDAADDAEPVEDEPADAEDEVEVEPEAAKTPMPNSWSKEDAKAWEALTPEAQAVVVRREAERDKFVRETGRKVAETRAQIETQAREILAQQAEQHAQALAVYAQRNMPQPPDQALLYTGNQDDVLTYQRQDAAYRAGAAQQQQLQQAIAQSQQQAEAMRAEALQAETQADAQRLAEQLPEWFDTSAGPKLRQELQSIGSELGYPAELMANASSTDILALKKAHEWKAKAEKLDKLMSKRMESVRAAKTLPKMTRPAVTQGKGQQGRASESRTSDAIAQFQRDRSPEAAAALLGSRNR